MVSRKAEILITLDEGFSQNTYYCTERYVTIGYGRKVSEQRNAPLTNERTTKEKEIQFVREKIREISYQLMSRFPVAWQKCNEMRQAVLISMCYQLGFTGISQFQKMWQALSAGNFATASAEMLNSRWANQTPNRARRYAEIMQRGDNIQYYLTAGQLP